MTMVHGDVVLSGGRSEERIMLICPIGLTFFTPFFDRFCCQLRTGTGL